MNHPARAQLALSYFAFVSLGLPDTVIGVAWPHVRDTFGLSQAGLGGLLVTMAAAYGVSSAVAGRLVRALGVGGLVAASSGAVAVGLVGYAAAPAWSVFLAAAVAIGAGSGAIDAALNGYAARHFPVRHVNWLHASWSLGATAGPALMTAVLAAGASFRTGYASIAVVLAMMAALFAISRRAWEDGASGPRPDRAPPGARGGGRAALSRLRVWLQIAIFLVYTGLEAGAGQWCFTVMREGRAETLETAGAWTTAYWASIGLGRVVLGFVIERLGPDRLLRVASATALAGAAAFAVNGGLAGRLGLVLLGASLAPMYPTLMARSPERLGHDVALHAVGFQVTAATIGSAAVPAVFGVLAARTGVAAIGPAVAIVAVVLLVLHECLLAATRR